jgi:tRNA (mo5U34)-methyltransferase
MSSQIVNQPVTSEESARQARVLGPWFHNLHLPGGIQTAPDHWLGDFPAVMWRVIAPHIATDLAGWSALDIGCNAGFYSFELAERGAQVTAIDCDEQYLAQARWAAQLLQLEDRIAFRPMQIYELARAGTSYDLVLFLGVFYHLRYPLLGLDIAARCTRRQLVFQTMTLVDGDPPLILEDLSMEDRAILSAPGWPRMAFVERKLQGDPTNWWVPNTAAVMAMLRSCGMRVTAQPGEGIFICEPSGETSSETPELDAAQYRAALGLPAA